MKYEKDYDVVVCGGGVAGVSAAVTASRLGLNAALVEKGMYSGGLATAGLVNIFLPLCDGNGTQILYGMPEELLKLSLKYSPFELPYGWGEGRGNKLGRYFTQYSPAAFALGIDELLEETNLSIWYDTRITDVKKSGERVSGVIVNNKSGSGVLNAKCVIDATGDADVAFFAGAELDYGDNIISYWGLNASLSKAESAVRYKDFDFLLNMIHLDDEEDICKREFSGIDGKKVSRYLIKSRRVFRNYYKKLIKESSNDYPLSLASLPQLRKTRKIVGVDSVKSEVKEITDDENGLGIIPDWRKPGDIRQIPAGALIPGGISGLLTAGRCISSESGDAWEVCRVIPVASFTGEAAGRMAFNFVKYGKYYQKQ